ncbi:expressed unknown protein [Seminavis robusta]|uniref:PH domain-containing protein n=1 Tax=Seminavis robusta TaxID=568900 RepID=A0A9N8HKV8_9STRA|nr:expressed unknown protein [Seminavis robusta]|eukprot:Sro640_g179870.1 n/a (1078) ;mRNA; f:25790-29122
MAAKQGLSAQISQASEDAKRAVLNRTSLTTSLWFSNLNTTCTIKSAPPRTPEVLSLLSTKSGWLFKRNEQHVWQTRWCCVVPHTFLYYFDANVLPGEAQPPVPSTALQEDWNQAVANGYPHRGNRKQQAPRSSLYFLPGGGAAANKDNHDNSGDHNSHHNNMHATHIHESSPTHAVHPPGGNNIPPASSESFASMQPAGIIDLECYTSVHRSAQNQLVLELAGDDAVNPDLRQFYFSAGSESETEGWTQALLGQRHTALMDETDAYKQVCDGFAQQLQVLHMEMDRAQKQAEDASEELYQVRSEMEDGRRSCWKLVEEVLDRQHSQAETASNGNNNMSNNPSIATSQSFRNELDAIRSQDISLLAPVQLLSDYTRCLEDTCNALQEENKQLQAKLSETKNSDHYHVQKLQEELEVTKAELERVQGRYSHDTGTLQKQLKARTKELEDLGKELASTRMETTMYQSSTRNKLTELQNHKKILKKEVLDLRHKLEDCQSELGLVKHKEKSNRLEVDQERKKAELLERYVDKMESQVKVQQNMMEMMSASGVGSVFGGSHYELSVPVSHAVHSPSTHPTSPPRRNIVLVNTPSNVSEGKEVINIHNGNTGGLQMPVLDKHGENGNRESDLVHLANDHHHTQRRFVEDDNKSHMSELTEDRTQKQFDALHYLRETRELRERELGDGRPASSNARILRYSAASPSPRGAPAPPAYIVGETTATGKYSSAIQQQHQQQLLQNFQNPQSAKLDTIHSSATAVTTPNRILPPDYNLPRSTRSPQPPPDQVMLENDNLISSSRSLGTGPQGRLSIAQRSRLQADQRTSTPVKVRLDSDSSVKQTLQQQARKEQPTSPTRTTGRMERRPSTSSRTSQGGGFFSSFGRKLEAAIDKSVFSVDVPAPKADRDDDDDSSSGSEDDESSAATPEPSSRYRCQEDERDRDLASTPVRKPALLTQESLDGPSTTGTRSGATYPTRNKVSSPTGSRTGASTTTSPRRSGYDSSSSFSDEKKTPTPDRTAPKRQLSLKERQQMQRAKQLQFLKDQGLIKDEVKDGASPSFDAGSVASTHLSSSGQVDSNVSSPRIR